MNNNFFNFRFSATHYWVMLCAVSALQLSIPTHAANATSRIVSGTLLESNSQLPISLRTVFIADFSTLSFDNSTLQATLKSKRRQLTSTAKNCAAPKVPYVSYTCTDNRGEFSLAISTQSSQRLVISDSKISINLKTNSQDTNLGPISVNNEETHPGDRIAIVSLSASSSDIGGQLNTADSDQNSYVVSYMFDSEILTGYGISITDNKVEYYRNFRQDTDGKSILDVKRFSTVLVKGSWQDIIKHYSQQTINSMLQFVEQGGTLLIKNNKQYSNSPSNKDQFI